MIKRMRNQVLSSIVVLAMVFSLVPALQVKTKADYKFNIKMTINNGTATVSWDKYSDNARYYLYKSNTKTGKYPSLICFLRLSGLSTSAYGPYCNAQNLIA